MSDLKDIFGNETLKEHFRTAVQQDKVSHAYIIEGEKGCGKKMLASAFAKILQCENRAIDACGSCSSCMQIEHRNHPDVIWVRHEKANVISVGEIREQVVNTMDVMPYKGPYKIYIVDEAEKMNPAAQNAILKTIEEPPGYGILLFLTTNRGVFLPTILSRCISLSMKPAPKEAMRNHLIHQLHVPAQTADFCITYAMGNMGKAIHAALSEEFLELRHFSVSVLQYMNEAEPFEIAEQVKGLKKWKESAGDFLDMMVMWFRDILILKISEKEEKMIGQNFDDGLHVLIFQEECPFTLKQCRMLSLEAINAIFFEIERTRVRLRANVNFEASMEVLLLFVKKQFQ